MRIVLVWVLPPEKHSFSKTGQATQEGQGLAESESDISEDVSGNSGGNTVRERDNGKQVSRTTCN